jgi:hypothetical protein
MELAMSFLAPISYTDDDSVFSPKGLLEVMEHIGLGSLFPSVCSKLHTSKDFPSEDIPNPVSNDHDRMIVLMNKYGMHKHFNKMQNMLKIIFKRG